MLDNFFISFNAVMSVFTIIAIGYAARKLLKVDKVACKKFNRIVYYAFISPMLFYNVYVSDFSRNLRLDYVGFVFGMLAIVYLSSWFIMIRIEKEDERRGVLIQAGFRGNYLVLGLPLMQTLFPGEDMGLVTALVALLVPSYNILAITALEAYRKTDGNESKKSRSVWVIVKGILMNPMFIAAFLGLALNLLHLSLPTFLEKSVSDITKSAGTVALMVLGTQFDFGTIHEQKKDIAITTLLRLVIYPAIVLFVGYLVGFRGLEFGMLIPIFGAPVAIASYNIATEMGGDSNLAANLVAVTTACSVFTLFLWIFIFKSLGAF